LLERYLPNEYHTLYKIINKHVDTFHELPTFESLKYEIRDAHTRDKLCALELVDVNVEPYILLEYLKNEYAQKEILNSIETYIEESVAFEDAEDSINQLYQIALDVETKVVLEKPEENMRSIELFDTDEQLGKYLSLGLNHEFDLNNKFSPQDLILFGGVRGTGKSLVCANMVANAYDLGKSSLYFTIEMTKRETLQRICAISTGLDASRIELKNLTIKEWETLALWWAARYEDSDKHLQNYYDHRNFSTLHKDLSTKCSLVQNRQIDIVYDSALTLHKIKSEVDKRLKSGMELHVIIVDYLNQVKKSATPSHRQSQYDWIEQIEIAKALKTLAQDIEVPIISPYQIDDSGQARFSKGILDSADAAYVLKAWKKSDNCMSFKCVKRRKAAEIDFSSYMDWVSLKIGPDSTLTPDEREDDEDSPKTGEEINDRF
jgi:hypothetical protein